MKRKTRKIVLLSAAALLLLLLTACGKTGTYTATYLGVKDTVQATRADVLAEDAKVYRFKIEGAEKLFTIDNGNMAEEGFVTDSDKDRSDDYFQVNALTDGGYPIQNKLIIGDDYEITTENGKIIAAEPLKPLTSTYGPLIQGTPGERSLKNLIMTAFEPMGTTLYVYGGGWDFQDIGSDYQAMSIGVSDLWVDFFNSQDSSYNYKGMNKDGYDYYPYLAWNTYHYLGTDCCGYLGWVFYNMAYDESLSAPGLMANGLHFVQNLDEKTDLGTFVHLSREYGVDKKEYYKSVIEEMQPGDFVSIPGHVYMVIGACEDGSLLVIHCTVTQSSTMHYGGGVQLSAVSPNGEYDRMCTACRLAEAYTKKFYFDWFYRYPIVMKDEDSYLTFPDNPTEKCTGIYHWNILDTLEGHEDQGLVDPDGFADMTAEEIMAALFGKIEY